MNTQMSTTDVAFRDRSVATALLISPRDLGVGAVRIAGAGSAGKQTTHPFLGKASPSFRAS